MTAKFCHHQDNLNVLSCNTTVLEFTILCWLVIPVTTHTICLYWNNEARAFLLIRTPNTGQLNPLFHTLAEFRPTVNRVVARQSTDSLAASAQFSPNDVQKEVQSGFVWSNKSLKRQIVFHAYLRRVTYTIYLKLSVEKT